MNKYFNENLYSSNSSASKEEFLNYWLNLLKENFVNVEQIEIFDELNFGKLDIIDSNKYFKFKIGKWSDTQNTYGEDYIFLYVEIFNTKVEAFMSSAYIGLPFLLTLGPSTLKEFNHYLMGSLRAKKFFRAPKSQNEIIAIISKKYPQFVS